MLIFLAAIVAVAIAGAIVLVDVLRRRAEKRIAAELDARFAAARAKLTASAERMVETHADTFEQLAASPTAPATTTDQLAAILVHAADAQLAHERSHPIPYAPDQRLIAAHQRAERHATSIGVSLPCADEQHELHRSACSLCTHLERALT
jgi:hypothetical protein